MVTTVERLEASTSTNNQMLSTMQAMFVQHERFTYNSTLEIKEAIEDVQDLEGVKKRQAAMEKELQTITQQNIKNHPPKKSG